MEIRTATCDDLSAVLQIAQTTAWDKDRYLRRQIDQRNVLVAEAEAVVKGFLSWNNEFFSLPFIWLVVVSPEHRRQGVATRLFDAVEAACAGQRLFSSTNLSHGVMQQFLENRGYRRSGQVDLDPGDPEVFFELSTD